MSGCSSLGAGVGGTTAGAADATAPAAAAGSAAATCAASPSPRADHPAPADSAAVMAQATPTRGQLGGRALYEVTDMAGLLVTDSGSFPGASSIGVPALPMPY